MDVDHQDEYEKEYENIISYNCDFIHDIHLLLSPISSLIQSICDDVTMIEIDYLSINNQEIQYNECLIKENWKLKKWNNVISNYELIMQSTSKRNYQIATINYHIASIQNLWSLLIKNNDNKDPYQIIKNSSHFNKLKLLFESNRDCVNQRHFITINQLLQFYSNLIILEINATNYDKANEMISKQLFESTHFHKTFNKHLQSKDWSQVIVQIKKIWMSDNLETQNKLLIFFKRYNSVIPLFIIYICIKLKLDQLDNMDDIQWIIQYLMNEDELKKFIQPLLDQFYILKSIYLLQDNKYNDSILTLNKCSEKNMPLSVFIKGWINFHILKDYKTSRKYFKLSAQSLSFGISHCINYFAFMSWKSNKYQQAIKLLQNGIKLSFNDKVIFDLCSINWIQLCLITDINNNIDIERILNVIKPETNKTLSWESSFTKITTEITKYDILRIKSQNNLLNEEYDLSYNGYKKVIQIIASQNDIDDQIEITSIYQQFCCSCIGINRIGDISKLGTKIDRNDFELDIAYIQSSIHQKQIGQDLIEIIKKIYNKYNTENYNEMDKQIISWWCSILSARCHEINGNLKEAEKYYDAASSDNINCLLSMYYHINIMRKMGNQDIETVVVWLNFLKISLVESTQFYKNKIKDDQEIEKYLSEKINLFKSFGINHKPSFCKNGILFAFIFKFFEFYKLDKVKLIELTKFCLTEWIKIINSTDFDQNIVKCFTNLNDSDC